MSTIALLLTDTEPTTFVSLQSSTTRTNASHAVGDWGDVIVFDKGNKGPMSSEDQHDPGDRFEALAKPADPLRCMDGLVCFWDFQDRTGGGLVSAGRHQYALEEMNGPIQRQAEGVFGPSSLHIRRGQWLRIQHHECPGLDLHGRQSLSVLAWVQRQADNEWQFIAGMWNERDARRQYALFTSGHMQAHSPSLSRTPALHQPHGYVSDSGGATEGCPFCFSYATGATRVETGRWTMLGFTYDLTAIRVYIDGRLDRNSDSNPLAWDRPIYSANAGGADFTIAQRAVRSWPDYPVGEPEREVGFGGLLGGVAVFDIALSAAQMAAIARQTIAPLASTGSGDTVPVSGVA